MGQVLGYKLQENWLLAVLSLIKLVIPKNVTAILARDVRTVFVLAKDLL
jgi:hypothetical protein